MWPNCSSSFHPQGVDMQFFSVDSQWHGYGSWFTIRLIHNSQSQWHGYSAEAVCRTKISAAVRLLSKKCFMIHVKVKIQQIPKTWN